MRATAVVVVVAVDGVTRYQTLRSDPPLLLRPTPGALQLVGGAAGPLGGDRLAYRVEVDGGANLTIRSVAASVVLPGIDDSSLDITVDVGDGAHLDWDPQPLISVVGSRHRQRTLIRLAPTATLHWCESLVLGRTAEEPGTLASVLRIERAGVVLHHNEFRVGDAAEGWGGAAGVAGARAVVTEVRVGPGDHESRVSAPLQRPKAPSVASDPAVHDDPAHLDAVDRWAVFALAEDASVLVATGRDLHAAKTRS